MKKFLAFFISIGLLWLNSQALFSQEKKEPKKEISLKTLKRSTIYYYSSERRDPFRDMLAGREIKEKTMAKGISQLSINDINLIGIVRVKGKHTAIVNTPQGFPHNIRVGDKLLDGFVLSIKDSTIVFRKTKERGRRLYRPKNVVKEIKPEER
jgi:Tfp pilus assembly protein PilP